MARLGKILCALGLPLLDVLAYGDAAGPTVLQRGLFSFQAPPGWKLPDALRDAGDTDAPASSCQGPAEQGVTPTIKIEIRKTNETLTQCAADELKAARLACQRVLVVESGNFSTAAGLDGVRMTTIFGVHGHRLQQITYLFEGGADSCLIATALGSVCNSRRDAALFDTSLKTLSLE